MSCGAVKQIQIQKGVRADSGGEFAYGDADADAEGPAPLQSAGRRGRRSSRRQQQQTGGSSCGLQTRGLPMGALQRGGSYGEVTVSKTMDMDYREPMGYQSPTFKHANGSPLNQSFSPVIPPRAVIPVAAAAAPIPEAFQYGGTGGGSSTHRAVHVNLKKHGVSRKVHLKPKRTAAEVVEKKLKTRHKTRRITLGLVGLAKRQTRAKRIGQKVKEMPLDALRSHLVAKGLIKANSKAPESILRQIAADAQILAGKGL